MVEVTLPTQRQQVVHIVGRATFRHGRFVVDFQPAESPAPPTAVAVPFNYSYSDFIPQPGMQLFPMVPTHCETIPINRLANSTGVAARCFRLRFSTAPGAFERPHRKRGSDTPHAKSQVALGAW